MPDDEASINVPESPAPQGPEEKQEASEEIVFEEADIPSQDQEDDEAAQQAALEELLGGGQSSHEEDDSVAELAGLMAGESSSPAEDRESFLESRAQLSGVSSEDLQRLLKVKVPLKVVLAEKETMFRDIVTLQAGSLIEFEKINDELLDIYVNEQPLGLGEVVKIHENFGIRLKEIISLKERIKKLGR